MRLFDWQFAQLIFFYFSYYYIYYYRYILFPLHHVLIIKSIIYENLPFIIIGFSPIETFSAQWISLFYEIYLIGLIGNRLKTSAQCLYRAPGKMIYSSYLNSILFFVESLTGSYREIFIFVVKRLINFFPTQKPAMDYSTVIGQAIYYWKDITFSVYRRAF